MRGGQSELFVGAQARPGWGRGTFLRLDLKNNHLKTTIGAARDAEISTDRIDCLRLCRNVGRRVRRARRRLRRHDRVGEAMLAAQFVAAAERNGVTTEGINGILKDIAAKSAIEEF
jgi:hypothetical protein